MESVGHVLCYRFRVRNNTAQQPVGSLTEMRLVVKSSSQGSVGVAPRSLYLIDAEAVAAHIIADIHRVLYEERVKPAFHREEYRHRE